MSTQQHGYANLYCPVCDREKQFLVFQITHRRTMKGETDLDVTVVQCTNKNCNYVVQSDVKIAVALARALGQ